MALSYKEKLEKIVPKRLEEIKVIIMNFANEFAQLTKGYEKEVNNVRRST